MNAASERIAFQAEVEQLLDLMIHSLYSHREIFLRELVSNASDALDKRRIEALTDGALAFGAARGAIRIELEPARRVLRVIDNGIGMTRQDLVENLGTIARSGTRRFLQGLKEKGSGGGEGQIGRFGVGFYASFMVAERIVVTSRRAGTTAGARWESDGKGSFTVEDHDAAAVGTCVELHLRPVEAQDEAAQDFCDAGEIAAVVRRYSDFVEWPIEMAAVHFEGRSDLARESASDGVEVALLNSRKPLWARAREEIRPEEYAAFYKHLAHAWDEPLETVHFRAEGASEYTALLFVPAERPLDLLGGAHEPRCRLSLYVRHVFVAADCEELLPPWLRFVHGVVDSQDLPLNVSREILQQNREMTRIRARLVRKLLDALAAMRDERREDYARLWKAFGAVLKEGLITDPAEREALGALLLYESSRGEGPTTLAEYAARAGESSSEVLVLPAEGEAAARRSPHLEAWRSAGREVLFLTDPIDEWVLEHCRELGGRKLLRIDRGPVAPRGAAQKEELEARERDQRALLEALEARLKGQVARVRFSGRLVESPAVLVAADGTPGPNLERLLRQSGQSVPALAPTLELNPGHPLIERLSGMASQSPPPSRLDEVAELLLGQACLTAGVPLADPGRFGRLVSELLLTAG